MDITLSRTGKNAGPVPEYSRYWVFHEKIWRKVVQKSTSPGMIARPDAHAGNNR